MTTRVLPKATDTIALSAVDDFIPGRTLRCLAAVNCNRVTAVGEDRPRVLSFAAPRPNPSASVAHFDVALPRAERVTLALFAANGARLRTIVDGTLPAGRHALEWDGRDERGARLAPGIYWARLQAGERSIERREQEQFWWVIVGQFTRSKHHCGFMYDQSFPPDSVADPLAAQFY